MCTQFLHAKVFNDYVDLQVIPVGLSLIDHAVIHTYASVIIAS